MKTKTLPAKSQVVSIVSGRCWAICYRIAPGKDLLGTPIQLAVQALMVQAVHCVAGHGHIVKQVRMQVIIGVQHGIIRPGCIRKG
jgi:hypothetical protein